jgi:SAM-dependent methyltransferase
MNADFKDHFSGHASAYAAARPDYPRELFSWLAAKAPARTCAWDCATGNGQAALALAEHFERVIATDASARQIANAVSRPGIEYRVAQAEAPTIKANSIDLVTVAQAAHWFDRPRFYAAVREVLRSGGLLALWGYGLFKIDPTLDELIGVFYSETVGPYWPPERRLIDEHYATFDFPFAEIVPPEFVMSRLWTSEQVLAYLRTWSAVQRYQEAQGADPVSDLQPELIRLWGDAATREVRWPLYVRAGYRD